MSLPYNSKYLTPTEKEVEREIEKEDCFHCAHLKRYKGGYRGCLEELEISRVLSGEIKCPSFKRKRKVKT